MRTVVDLLRHGEPVGGRKIRGQSDDPLSETGWEQMCAAVADGSAWDAVLTSPLTRCAGFASELAQARGLPVAQDPRLKEIGFGVWEGLTHEAIDRAEPGALARFRANPTLHAPQGAEPVAEFRWRVVAAWNDLTRAYAGKRLLVVGHAGMIRAVISHVLGMPVERMYRISVPYAARVRLEVDGAGEGAVPRLLLPADWC
jgi:alpha-ribazole phosphatase